MSNSTAAPRAPKVVLRKNSTKPTPTPLPGSNALELVLIELGKGNLGDRRAMFRRHCEQPMTMTKVTVWALHQLGLRLQKEGLDYNRFKFDEVRRLLSLAPQGIKKQLALGELI